MNEMKKSTNIHYRREDRPLGLISVPSGLQLVATAAFDEFILNLQAVHCGRTAAIPRQPPPGDDVRLLAESMPRGNTSLKSERAPGRREAHFAL
jgi:hypothetical protein